MNYALALLGIMLGTVGAQLLLPLDYYEPGGLWASCLTMSAGLLVGPLFSSLTNLRGWLRAESVMMMGLIYWLLIEPLSADYEAFELSREGVERSFLLIGLFAATIQAGSFLAHHWHAGFARPQAQADFSDRWLFNALLACAGLGLLARLIPCQFSPVCMVEGLFGTRDASPWNRGVLGGTGAFASHLQYFGYLTLPLTVALHHRVRRIDWRVALGLLLTTIFILFLIKDGGRRLVGMVAGSGLLTWLLLQPRIQLRQVLVGGLAAVLLLALMEIMLIYRTAQGGVVGALFSGRAVVENPLAEGIKVDNNFRFLTQTVDLIPQFREHTGWSAIVYWVVRPVPRAIWPDKPIGPGISIPYELDQWWGDNFTLTISAVGDWYIAFGARSVAVAGLMMGLLGGLLVRSWMRPSVRSSVLYSLGAMCLFIGLRNYLELILMSYPILALLLIGKFTDWLPNRSPALRLRRLA